MLNLLKTLNVFVEPRALVAIANKLTLQAVS